MPIVDVQVFGEAEVGDRTGEVLAQAIGDALGAPAGGLWLTLSHRSAREYAENGPTPSPLPVFVRVLARREPTADDGGRAAAVAGAVARVLGRPVDRVHVVFEADARGRVFFGGQPDRR